MDISVKELTTYRISEDGESIVIVVADEAGKDRALTFRLAELGNLLMTLPQLIEAALRRQYRDASFRFAYPIGSWSVEQASDPGSVIVTLRTTDGFGVSFSMARGKAKEFASSMTIVSAPPRSMLAH